MTLPEQESQIRLLNGCGGRFSDEAFTEFCRVNPDLRIERNSDGAIIVMPPAGGESSSRNLRMSAQLSIWADRDGRGEAFDSSAGFRLADGSILSPDAAWVSNEALHKLTPKQRKGFLPLCPEFVIEILSPSDRLADAKRKMAAWADNGARLGWLIDAEARTIYVYRQGRAAKARRNIAEILGEGPVTGFTLNLTGIWRGLA